LVSARDFSSFFVVGGSAGASAQDRSAARRQKKQGYDKWLWINTYENTIFSGLFTSTSINPSYFDVN